MAIRIEAGDAHAEITTHGAQVLSWVIGGTVGGRELLYVSPTADFGEGQPIRGGIPVCFPQFDERGPLPKHGFARNAEWTVVSSESNRVVLELVDSEHTRSIWPQAFRAEIAVTIEPTALDVQLSVENRGDTVLTFTGALHTYFRIDDRNRASLRGFGGVEYRDHRSGESSLGGQNDVAIEAIGRTYRDPRRSIVLSDRKRRITIDNRGFGNVVVWNPGDAMTFRDLPPDGWQQFVCIEAAQVERPVEVQPGGRWVGGQRSSVEMGELI